MSADTRRVEIIAVPDARVPEDWHAEAREDQLLAVGSDSDVVVEMAGRVCYDSFGTGRSSADFHDHLAESGHVNPTYHAVFVFRGVGYSRSMTKELFRHHVGTAPSERSGRFVDEALTRWTDHPVLEAFMADDENWIERYAPFEGSDGEEIAVAIAEAVGAGRRAYRVIVRHLQPWLEKKGYSKHDARKQARAAARQYLGNGLETEFVFSANIEAIRNIIRQRGGPAADAEIRDFAVRLASVMVAEAPTYFRDVRFENDPVVGKQVFLGPEEVSDAR